MSASSSSYDEAAADDAQDVDDLEDLIMSHSLKLHFPPRSLLAAFNGAVKGFRASHASFRVLCSLPSESHELEALPPAHEPKNLLVLDSSFNPPTLAHQRMALSALAAGQYVGQSRILLLLAINNADKAPKPAAFNQRLAMMYVFALDLLTAAKRQNEKSDPSVDIAITTEPYFHLKSEAIAGSDFYMGTEPAGGDDSAKNGEDGPQQKGSQQVYLTGFDTLIRIFNPKYYADAGGMREALDPLFSRSKLRVTMRTDDEWGDAEEQERYLENLREGKLEAIGGRSAWAERVEMVEGKGADEEAVSSTKVRQACGNEDWTALARLVSDGVKEWIRDEGLYREGDLERLEKEEAKMQSSVMKKMERKPRRGGPVRV